MNTKLYNATCARLQAKTLESISAIDTLLSQRPPSLDAIDQVTAQALQLVQCEGALLSLQQYFHPPPSSTVDPPLKVTAEMSPTYAKSLEKQKIKDSATKSKAKKKNG